MPENELCCRYFLSYGERRRSIEHVNQAERTPAVFSCYSGALSPKSTSLKSHAQAITSAMVAIDGDVCLLILDAGR